MLLPNFYLFVSLHNGLGSLHGIRTGRAKRATHATETKWRTERGTKGATGAGDNRKSMMHETATTTRQTHTHTRTHNVNQEVCLTARQLCTYIYCPCQEEQEQLNPPPNPCSSRSAPYASHSVCAPLRCTLHAARCTKNVAS